MDWINNTREYISSFFENAQDDGQLGQEAPVVEEQEQPKQEPVVALHIQEMPVHVVLPEYAVGYNHLIVREIANYLPFASLQKLRAVSHHWNNNFSSVYFRGSTVSLISLQNLNHYTNDIEEFLHSQFKLFIRKLGIGEDFLVRPIRFRPFFLKYGEQISKLELKLRLLEPSLQPLHGWLGLLGTLENVEELSIDWDFWGYVPPVPYVIPELPTLKKLTIDVNATSTVIPIGNANEFALSFVNVILSMAPKLQYLIVWDISTQRYQDWRYNFYSGLVERIKEHPASHLNKLCFNGCFGIFDALLPFPVPLTRLTIHVDKRRHYPNGQMSLDRHAYANLNKLLRLHGDTLEHLYLEVLPVQVTPAIHRFCIRLPQRMPKLKSLKLSFNKRANVASEYEFPIAPMANYPQEFPKLETLWVSIGGCYRSYEKIRDRVHGVMFPSEGCACNSVVNVSLQMPDERNSYQLGYMKKRNDLQTVIGRMFPNAKMEIFQRGFVPDPKYVI